MGYLVCAAKRNAKDVRYSKENQHLQDHEASRDELKEQNLKLCLHPFLELFQ